MMQLELEIFAKDTSGNAPYSTAFIKSLNEQNNGTLPSGSLSFGTASTMLVVVLLNA